MAVNPYAYSQAQGAARMPQVGFGQSSPSPLYGGGPNRNAYANANPAANLGSRFGGSSVGGGLPLPGSSPDYSTPNQPGELYNLGQPVTGGGYPLPNELYNLGPPVSGGRLPVTGGGYPLPGGQYNLGPPVSGGLPPVGGGYPSPRGQYNLGPPLGVNPFARALQMYGRFRQLNPSGFQNANPNANLGSRFGGGYPQTFDYASRNPYDAIPTSGGGYPQTFDPNFRLNAYDALPPTNSLLR